MKGIVLLFMISIFLFSCKKNLSEFDQLSSSSNLKNKHARIVVCHYDSKKGTSHSITIDANAWPAHQAHGDVLGNCSEGTPCRIVSINEEYGDRLDFYYTSWGDPELMDIQDEGTARTDIFFKYDNQKRLVELQERYRENGFEGIKRFYYEADKVVKDSIFIFPASDLSWFYACEVGKYLYDNYDRIIEYNFIRYSTVFGGFDEEMRDTLRYNYPSEDPYTGNRNYSTGNRVLMFVNKDYNKTTEAVSYNDFGYPTKFSDTQNLFMAGYPVRDIQYDCSGSVKTK